MTEINMQRMRLIGRGYAEMPQDGRRYRFLIERYRHDDGTEYGHIVSMEEIPDVGPYLWIPSMGIESEDELQYLRDEFAYDSAKQDDWWGEHRDRQKQMMERYNELRDARAARVKANPRTGGT